MQMSLSFIIANDHFLFSKGLADFLQIRYTGCYVCETGSIKELRNACSYRSYDIFFIDVKILETYYAHVQDIMVQNRKSKIIATSLNDGETYINEMFKDGVHGYIYKTSSEKEISNTIQNVLNRWHYISKKQVNKLSQTKILQWINNDSAVITKREKEILQLLCIGLSSKEIAAKLYLSIKTVENHRNHLLEKISVHNTAGLIAYAMRRGWVDFEMRSLL